MAPRSSEQNEKIRSDRMEEILNATIEVYLEKGVRATEISDVAKKAGVARSLVYYYYKDKMELFRDLFTKYIQAAQTYIKASLTSEEDTLIKLKKYVRFYLETTQKNPQFMKFYRQMEQDIEYVFEGVSDDVLKSYTLNTRQPLIQLFQQGIKEGTLKESNVRLMVHVYWGALTSTLEMFANKEFTEQEAQQQIDTVIDLIFKGIQNDK